MLPIITAKPEIHRNRPVLKLSFPYEKGILEMIRTIPGVLWSNSLKGWYIPDTGKSLSQLRKLEGVTVIIKGNQVTEARDGNKTANIPDRLVVIRYAKGRIRLIFKFESRLVALIKTMPFYYYDAEARWWTLPHMESVLTDLKKYCSDNGWLLEYRDEWVEQKIVLRKKDRGYDDVACPPQFEEKLKAMRYSESTVRNYCSAIREYIHFFAGRQVETLNQNDIEKFLLYITEERHVSLSYHKISLSAIKFFYEKILEKPEVIYKVSRPRGEKTLPEVLSEEEVIRLFRSISNLKHLCILMTTYSGGLRLSEVVGLRVSDIDSSRMKVFIKGAKGRKDRYTVLSKELLKWLREYYKEEKPKFWLFEGATGGQYSMRSVQNIMREAVKKAEIKKHATVHTLRHSFATHMLENGTDLRYIQNLLGHNSSKTTEIYTHITTKGLEQLVSPFDRLKIQQWTYQKKK